MWGDWAGCSSSCNTGIRVRERLCLNGEVGTDRCRGNPIQEDFCNAIVSSLCTTAFWGPSEQQAFNDVGRFLLILLACLRFDLEVNSPFYSTNVSRNFFLGRDYFTESFYLET